MPNKTYALVKWIGGVDDKKYTAGIPIEWVRSFNVEEFRSENFDPSLSYVIELRGTKKCPPGGWPVYDGYVIAVSGNIRVLENKLEALDVVLSPKAVVFPTEEEKNIDDKTDESSAKASKQRTKKRRNDEELSRNSLPLTITGPSGSGTSEIPTSKSYDLEEASTPHLDDPKVIQISGCVPHRQGKAKVQLYKSAEEGNLKQELIAIHQELKRLKKKRSRNDSTDSSASSENREVEIAIRKNSGIFITDEQWDTAKIAKSYTAMGLSLLLSLFPMDVLLKSNLRGGSRKVNGGGDANENTSNARHSALDTDRIEALFYTVRKRWKAAFNKAGLGLAINNKLSQLRAAQKKKQQAHNN